MLATAASLETVSRAQAAGQLTAQLASPLDEQRLVDGLVAHPHLRVVGEVHPQALRDLLRRPQLLQTPGHLLQQATRSQLARLRSPGLLAGPLVRMPRRVAVPAAVARDLSADRGGGAVEASGDRGQRLPSPDPDEDVLAVGDAQTARSGIPPIG